MNEIDKNWFYNPLNHNDYGWKNGFVQDPLEDLQNEHPSLDDSTFDLNDKVVIDGWKEKLGSVILRVFRLSLGFFRSIFHFKRNSSKGVGEYCFTQQYNDSCHISPIMNLKILENIRKVGFQLDQVDFLSKRQWLGEDQKMLTIWHDLMARVCKDDAQEKYPNLYHYLTEGIKKGPVLPHFYNEKGDLPFHGLGGIIEFSELPFFLIDIDDLEKVKFKIGCQTVDFSEMIEKENLGLKTAIVREKGIYKVYNRDSKTFIPFDQLDWIRALKLDFPTHQQVRIVIDWEKITEKEIKIYSLPPKGYEIKMKDVPGLGFEQMGVVNELGGGLKLKNSLDEEHTYIPFEMSLMKLLFLVSGIDEKNNTIQENNPIFPVYKELEELMAEDSANMWHPNHLSKDKLLQYHLAEIFKENRALYRQAAAVVDVLIGNWKNYKGLRKGEFYQKDLHKMNEKTVRSYILGSEQALAYYFMQTIRMSWYSSVNPDIFIKAIELGLPSQLSPLTHQYLKAKLFETHKIKNEDGSVSKKSFLDVWADMREKLSEKVQDRKDFISFDDHGWVVSFDEELIEKQNNCPVYDKSLLKKLGIAGIESWWGSELGLWYKRDRKVTKK